MDVQTGDRDRAGVEVTIEEDDQTAVDDTKIRFDADADRLDVETDYDELKDEAFFGLVSFGSTDRPATHYTLTIPRTADLAVDTYSAATTVPRLEGDVTFDEYSAAPTVERLTGTLKADTYSGDLKMGRIDGSLSADTYSGALGADSIAGPVTFSTYSGSATLGFAALTDDCRFDSFTGDVSATVAPRCRGRPRNVGGRARHDPARTDRTDWRRPHPRNPRRRRPGPALRHVQWEPLGAFAVAPSGQNSD